MGFLLKYGTRPSNVNDSKTARLIFPSVYRFPRGGLGSVESRNVVSATKRLATPVDVVVEEVFFLVIDMRYIPVG